MNDLECYRNEMRFHVGEYLKDFLDARGWSFEDCAERMGGDIDVNELSVFVLVAASELDDTDKPKQCLRLGKETARGLAKAFGTSERLWLNLDAAYHGTKYDGD